MSGAPARTTVVGLLVVSLGVLATGCANRIDRSMEVWMGAHYSDLIDSWGPPEQVFEDDSDGHVMVWMRDRQVVVPGRLEEFIVNDSDDDPLSGSPGGFNKYRPTQIYEYQVWRAFWVDRSGQIYRWERQER